MGAALTHLLAGLLAVFLSIPALAGEGGFDHSHGRFGQFLEGAVRDRGVDYAALASRRAMLDAYLADLAAAPIDTFSTSQKLALWVNAYNAATVATILAEMPLKSIRDIDGGEVWKRRTFTIAGQTVTLDQMEHERARKIADGRVHAVVNCASKGCPPLPLKPIVAAGIEAQLDAASRRWAKVNGYRIDGDTVYLNRIFEWYSVDFTPYVEGDIAGAEGAQEAAMWFLSKFVPDDVSKRLRSGALKPQWQEYDWALNGL